MVKLNTLRETGPGIVVQFAAIQLLLLVGFMGVKRKKKEYFYLSLLGLFILFSQCKKEETQLDDDPIVELSKIRTGLEPNTVYNWKIIGQTTEQDEFETKTTVLLFRTGDKI